MSKTENKEKAVKTVSKKPATPIEVKESTKKVTSVVKKEAPKTHKPVVKKDKINSSNLFTCKDTVYATGKRKTAVAKVWIKVGKGLLIVNDKDATEYTQSNSLFLEKISRPLILTNNKDKFDIRCDVSGGGISAQSEAIMYGLAKALTNFDKNFRMILKEHDLLTRDSRIVERKKYGKKKARKSAQFSKR